MQDEVYGKINDKQRTCLSRIDESGRHLLTLINDILDLSKIKAGMFRFEIKPVNIVEICSTCINMTKPAAQKKGIRMSISYDMTIEVIHADEKALRQILINLLNNSVKFTPEGGKIGLETKNDTDKAEVAFSVWDTGIGIDKKDWDKLFKPFVQLDGGLCKQYGGTGLGLSLVNRLVEMHGGRIVLESKPGEGSRFTVFIPCEPIYDATDALLPENPEISAHNMQPEEKPSSSLTILMAEDNEDNISTFSDYLTAKGFRVEVARNGLEAIQTARRTLPDLILMDIQMPEMDGLETIRILKNDPDLSHIPIIALTSLAMVGDRDRCLQAGADEYISKPIRLRKLVETIHSILQTPPSRE
jgi:CheY-like chemotaxis protein/two-component sensor histidine kinase